jgi:hypothetical protein
MDEVFVFVHGQDGKAIGAGPLISTPKRKDLVNTLPGMAADYDRDGDPEEVMAVVKSTGLAYYVVPLTRISSFDQHPGYRQQG